MATPELPHQRPQPTAEAETEEDGQAAADVAEPAPPDASVEELIERMIESRTGELESELDELREQVEEVENFARISLNERKLKQSEVNLSEFSDSMSSFAETAFNNINRLEARLNLQSVLLAAIVDSLAEEGLDLDLAEVERQQQDSLVMQQTPEERLEAAIEEF